MMNAYTDDDLQEADDLNFTIDVNDDAIDDRLENDQASSTVSMEFGSETGPSDVTRDPVEQWEIAEQEERRQVGGAAVAGAIAGLVVAGPVGCLLLGGGMAALSTTKSKAGEVTRNAGEFMAQAGDKLKQWDQKHHVTEKAAHGFAKSADWVSNKLKPKRERDREARYGLTA